MGTNCLSARRWFGIALGQYPHPLRRQGYGHCLARIGWTARPQSVPSRMSGKERDEFPDFDNLRLEQVMCGNLRPSAGPWPPLRANPVRRQCTGGSVRSHLEFGICILTPLEITDPKFQITFTNSKIQHLTRNLGSGFLRSLKLKIPNSLFCVGSWDL